MTENRIRLERRQDAARHKNQASLFFCSRLSLSLQKHLKHWYGMMTPKQQTLYAMMECEGYSYGCMQMVMSLLGASREALDDMILFIEDEHPSERELIAKLAEFCEWNLLHNICKGESGNIFSFYSLVEFLFIFAYCVKLVFICVIFVVKFMPWKILW